MLFVPRYLEHMRVGYFASKITEACEMFHSLGEERLKIGVLLLVRSTFSQKPFRNALEISCLTQFKLHEKFREKIRGFLIGFYCHGKVRNECCLVCE